MKRTLQRKTTTLKKQKRNIKRFGSSTKVLEHVISLSDKHVSSENENTEIYCLVGFFHEIVSKNIHIPTYIYLYIFK